MIKHTATKTDAKRRKQTALDKKRAEESSSSSSDSESSSSSSSPSDSESSDGDERDERDDKINMQEYRKELAKLFPSKHINNKIAAGDRLSKNANKGKEKEKEKEVNKVMSKKSIKSSSNDKKKSNKKLKNGIKKEEKEKEQTSSEDEDCDDDDDEDLDDDTSSSSSEEKGAKGKGKEAPKSGKKPNKFNIVFTIDDAEYDDDDEEEWETDSYDDDDEDYYDEDDEEEDEEEDEDVEVSDSEDDDESDKNSNLDEKGVKTTKEDLLKTTEGILTTLTALQNDNKGNQIIQDCVKACENTIKETKTKLMQKTVKQKAKNERIFKKNLRQKSSMNDFIFFKKLDIEQQKKIIKELREINKLTLVEKPYRLTLLESTMPTVFKSAAMKRINALKHMEHGSGEYYKIKNWVDTFMKIPFGTYETLPISISNGVENCHAFMESALSKLDTAVYGLNDAKMQIMQMMGQLISNPSAVGTSIAIHGPMGTGKTSLVREGISKILNRPFAFIALGGATDSSFLEGHSYTYEGSTWGQIVQILIASKCMNPVIYFDELDKISETPKGDEIASILTHLTDSSQNSQFHDKYFSDIDFDLSKCLFIFSYNDESKINPILRDRMYKIKTSGYDKKQKTLIANQYLLPRIREQVKFDDTSIIIPDEALQYIIDNHCGKEEGVRNLKRCLEIIYTKLNLYRLMKPGTNLFEQEISLKVEFPFTVTKDTVDKIIKIRKDNDTWKNLYN